MPACIGINDYVNLVKESALQDHYYHSDGNDGIMMLLMVPMLALSWALGKKIMIMTIMMIMMVMMILMVLNQNHENQNF